MAREISSLKTICSQPLIADPYEARHVEVSHCKPVFMYSQCTLVQVRPSGEAGGGEGLYASRDIEAGIVVSFYNGIRIRAGAEKVREKILNRFCVHVYSVFRIERRRRLRNGGTPEGTGLCSEADRESFNVMSTFIIRIFANFNRRDDDFEDEDNVSKDERLDIPPEFR